MRRPVFFERAIFLSWYCARPTCTFCYMSTIKEQITDPRRARRRPESILTEAVIAKACGWKIEFLSGGIHSHSIQELVDITRQVSSIMGEKQWLNFGIFDQHALERFLPYVQGMTGTVECINPRIHDQVCPDKPLAEVKRMFGLCDRLGLRKAMTLIVGLGETEEDIPLLLEFIRKHAVDRITFYRLIPHPGTPFGEGPATKYYCRWIQETRKAFPDLDIIAGSWSDRIEEIPALLEAGADGLTKFQAIKYFGSRKAEAYHRLVGEAGVDFQSTFLRIDDQEVQDIIASLDVDEARREKVRKRTENYLHNMRKRKGMMKGEQGQEEKDGKGKKTGRRGIRT
ncbi:MAG: radical SAM protein [DPANN group archaeon]|nr:radical SAM protein [DPANN group archaeon]